MRFVRGLAALAVLLAGVVGAPVLLVAAGRLPELARLWQQFPQVLITPDNGAVLLGVLTLLGWGAWAVFVLSVLGELVGMLCGLRVRLPGLARPQAVAAALLLSVAAMASSPTSSYADANNPGHLAPPAEHVAPLVVTTAAQDEEADQKGPARHLVAPGDELWSIAERYYGEGRAWRQIAEANALADPTRLAVGASLVLPGLTAADVAAQEPAASAEAEADASEKSPAERIAYATAGINSLGAAALLGLLATRRQVQMAQRPIGQRVPPTPQLAHLENALGQSQDPLTVTTLDLALRALARHHRETETPLPALGAVLVTDDRISLELARMPLSLPPGFHGEGSRLWIGCDEGERLAGMPGLADEPAPYPSLVCLGETPSGALLLHDLETIGMLGLHGEAALVGEVFDALLLELVCAPWASGQDVSVVGRGAEVVQAAEHPQVRVRDDVDALLVELEQESWRRQRERREQTHPRDRRTDPELAEAWRPHVVLVGHALTDDQRSRFEALVARHELVLVAADDALPGAELRPAPCCSELPNGCAFVAQAVPAPVRDQAVDLLRSVTTHVTERAPWWSEETTHVSERSAPPDNVRFLGPRRPTPPEEAAAMDSHEPVLHPPTVHLVGPIELTGTRGSEPSRALRQCIEYAAWLLEHPGATSTQMANALFVAETTRRSNMSRLRGWLGSDEEGEPYLPDAYSGRIHLHPAVTSDWQRMQLLTIGGVDRTSDPNLVQVLELVRGAPLADAAPGQWHWAEELRSDISAMVRDVGVVLAERALDRGDVDLARWAANRALAAAPEDELLLCARVRTEHRANNPAEVERLALRMVRHARRLNVDLADETVELLQQVMEGGVRARQA